MKKALDSYISSNYAEVRAYTSYFLSKMGSFIDADTVINNSYLHVVNIDGNPGNDFGDSQSSGSCSWTFCVTLTVANVCTPQNLLIQVTPGSDGVFGSYTSTSCDLLTPFTVFNGTINSNSITIGPISHN
jgi:hypothetical protein